MNLRIGDLYFKINPSPEQIYPMDKNERIIPLLNDKEVPIEFSYKKHYAPVVKEEAVKHTGYCDRVFTLVDFDKYYVTLKTNVEGIDYRETISLKNLNQEFISFEQYFSTAKFINREAYRVRPIQNEDETIDKSFFKDNLPDYFYFEKLINLTQKLTHRKQVGAFKHAFKELKKNERRKPPVFFNALNERELDYKDILLFANDNHFIINRTYLKSIGNLTEKDQIIIVPQKYLNDNWVYDRRLASDETFEECLKETFNYLSAFAIPIDLGYSYTKKRNYI